MRRQFQKTFDQVRMSPEQTDRVRRTLAGRAEERPRRGGRRFSVLVVLASAAVLLMGAAAVWQSKLLQYFQGPGGSQVSGLSQYSQPVGISGTSEDGWTLTVDECMGDDQWTFLWLTLSAPEGTELPVLQEGDAFYVNLNIPDLGMDKIQVFDESPEDHQLNLAAGICAGRNLSGETISLRVTQIQYRPGDSGEMILLQDGEFVVDGIALNYPNTVTYTQPMVQVPYFDGSVQATGLKVTPFSVSMEFASAEPVEEIIDRQLRQSLGECPAPTDPAQLHSDLVRIFQGLEEPNLSLSVVMKDKTVWDLTAAGFETSSQDPCRFTGQWDFRLEVLKPGTWEESFFLDPAQIDSFILNGVEIPFTFAPEESSEDA